MKLKSMKIGSFLLSLTIAMTMFSEISMAKDSNFVPPDTDFNNAGQGLTIDGKPMKWPSDIKWTSGIPYMDEIQEKKPLTMPLLLGLGGDIVIGDDTEHGKVFETTRSKKLDVTGILDVSRIKQLINYMKTTDTFKSSPEINLSNTQSTFITTLKFPVELSLPSGDLNSNVDFVCGNDAFTVSKVEKTDDNTIKITFKLKEGISTFNDLHRDVTGVNDKLKITVKNVTVNEKAKYDTNYTLIGNVGGYMFSNICNPMNMGFYMAYYTRQTDEGKDAVPNNENITFTLVVKEKHHVVTFMKDGSEYKKVNVEEGMSIESDKLKDQSMPKNPTKAGYTFKEWNTQRDGKGSKFDGKTTVNNDITVYAIFVKKPNNPRPNPNKPVPGRIDGGDRIETGIEISKKHYDKAKTVIVVRHDLFPDSMTASVLAKLKDAPILLNPTNKLDPRVGAEIKRLGASEVIIVGGQNSISEKVREELRIYDVDKDVERIAGHDRYGTSEMVARRVVGITGKKNKAVVASGEVFPDALAVGTYASREGYPILLVRKDLVPTQITKAIKDLEIKNTYIAGGYNTISKSTELKLPGVLERMAGKTRYETAIAIARSKFADSKEAYIASGEEFADALAISPMSGKYNRPTLLVKSKAGQNKPVSDYVYFKNINRITAIGGYRYIPNDVLKELVN